MHRLYGRDVSEFLVEVYVSPAAAHVAAARSADVSKAVEQLSGEGRHIRLLRCIFVPEEETCFYLFDAQSSGDVREAAQRSGLRFDRISEVGADWTTQKPLTTDGAIS